MNKKEIKNEELETVNGGSIFGAKCPNCGYTADKDSFETRKTTVACATGEDRKCPQCGTWFNGCGDMDNHG